MQKTIIVTGEFYSDNKTGFKKILKEFDVKWKGSWTSNIYTWSGNNIIVNADFERDEVTDRTIRAIFDITSDSEFMEEVMRWAHNGLISDVSGEDKRVQELNAKWKKDIEWEKKSGAPQGVLQSMKKQWKEEVDALEK